MFAVIYRIQLKPGKENEYLQAWQQIADYFMTKKRSVHEST